MDTVYHERIELFPKFCNIQCQNDRQHDTDKKRGKNVLSAYFFTILSETVIDIIQLPGMIRIWLRQFNQLPLIGMKSPRCKGLVVLSIE